MPAILIVDDELLFAETLKDCLEDAGYVVTTVRDGRGALEAMNQRVPDLVITDLMMPVMNGKELLIAMRREPRLAAIPAILMSAARKQIAVPPGEDFPQFSTFLRKPFLLKPLMDAVVALVGPGR